MKVASFLSTFSLLPSLSFVCLLGLGGIAVFSAGCAGSASNEALMSEIDEKFTKQLDLVDQKNELIKDRMSVLENDNREMRELLERIVANQENPADLDKQVASILELQVDDLITSKLASKIDETPVSAVDPVAIRNEIAAYEEQKRVEAEAEREQRRAEDEARREERRQEEFAAMSEKLGLNQQQSDQLQVAQQTMRKGFEELFANMREGNGRENMRENMTALRETHAEIIKQFLSDEQATAYLEENNRFGRGGPGGGPGGGRDGGGRRGGGR